MYFLIGVDLCVFVNYGLCIAQRGILVSGFVLKGKRRKVVVAFSQQMNVLHLTEGQGSGNFYGLKFILKQSIPQAIPHEPERRCFLFLRIIPEQ